MKKLQLFLILAFLITLNACTKSDTVADYVSTESYPNVTTTFSGKIDLNNLSNYENQTIPNYITKDNTNGNPITNKGATLGRVLFYDKNLSSNNTISCSSCHKQTNAFGDEAIASDGINGTTTRHSMRLINSRFANETKFFWDERASNLENQTTQPIQNHIEMGFSGTNGDSGMSTLIAKLQNIGYYKELFKFVYGTEEITETKIQLALAQFIRSIQSFDSKYDSGRALVQNDNENFSNFTAQENQGKNLPTYIHKKHLYL
jgi:cytochrome c peroxidase